MSSFTVGPGDGDTDVKQLEEQPRFVSWVKQRDVTGVRALLQSMSSDEARVRLFEATSKGFGGVFKPSTRAKEVGTFTWMRAQSSVPPNGPRMLPV